MKRTTVFLAALALTLSFAAQLRAQDAEAKSPFEEKTVYGVGLQASFLSGYGVGFRYHPAGRFGAQIVGGGITASKRFIGSVGLEGHYDFDYDGRSRFYGFVGLGYYSNGYDAPVYPKKDERLSAPFRVGLGVAYEISLSRKLIFTPSLGFTWFPKDATFWPIPMAALYYYFN
jgi:hypothetical protein